MKIYLIQYDRLNNRLKMSLYKLFFIMIKNVFGSDFRKYF